MEPKNPKMVVAISVLQQLLSPLADDVSIEPNAAYFRLRDTQCPDVCCVDVRWDYVNAWKPGLKGVNLTFTDRGYMLVHHFDVTGFSEDELRAFIVRKLKLADVFYQPTLF